jgi:hypothetical protein
VNRSGAARAALAIAGSVAAGAATELSLVLAAVLVPPRIVESSEVLAIRDGTVWHGSERRSPLLHWVNAESAASLVNRDGPEGSLPPWAEPAAVDAPGGYERHGALALGWPLRFVGMRWSAQDSSRGFPPPAEVETSGDAPKEASRLMAAAWLGDPPPAGGHGEGFVLWGSLLADIALLAVPWFAAAAAIAGMRAGRARAAARAATVTPRG